MQCTNHLKQMGLAVHNFHDTRGGLPPTMVNLGRMTFWCLILPYAEQQAQYDQICAIVLDPFPDGMEQMTKETWWDKLTTEEQKNSACSIPWVKCPTRRAGIARCDTGSENPDGWGSYGIGPRSDYAIIYCANTSATGNASSEAYWLYKIQGLYETGEVNSPFRYALSPGRNWKPPVDMSYWQDGTSNQFIIGEKHIPQDFLDVSEGADNAVAASDVDGSFFVQAVYWRTPGGRFNVARPICSRTPRLARGPQDSVGISNLDQSLPAYGFGSYHSGICNFLLGDGSVKSVSVTTSPDVLRSYADVSDGKTPGSL